MWKGEGGVGGGGGGRGGFQKQAKKKSSQKRKKSCIAKEPENTEYPETWKKRAYMIRCQMKI